MYKRVTLLFSGREDKNNNKSVTFDLTEKYQKIDYKAIELEGKLTDHTNVTEEAIKISGDLSLQNGNQSIDLQCINANNKKEKIVECKVSQISWKQKHEILYIDTLSFDSYGKVEGGSGSSEILGG